ncbi:LysM domain-containing protein [Lactobacillus sp. CBA3605]|uniref:aggregation-promoting factor n=1 Tax=Lactobacillus sp. CBA3605 TaxID=2099788 RepID=UPI000CFE0F4F|nr:LysM domain-containing protein [Lactobacillus sp. CBA3605]AVK61723.1 LysM domain-containing protein [Lactobacillus sp. CBA3605]
MKIKNLALSTAAALALFAATTTAADAATVTVKAGDTVAEIANTYNTSVDAIKNANNLSNVNLIFVGDQLEVNGTATTTTTSTTTPVANTTTTTAATTQSNHYQAAVSSSANTTNNTTVTTAPKAAATSSSVATTTTKPAASTTSTSTTTTNGSEGSAKAWIANKESGGSYSATNGNYYGKYQLSKSYLNGDYSAANQEKVANSYVASRYGSWAAAKAHSQANGWY